VSQFVASIRKLWCNAWNLVARLQDGKPCCMMSAAAVPCIVYFLLDIVLWWCLISVFKEKVGKRPALKRYISAPPMIS